MAFAPIAKLEKFTSKKDNVQSSKQFYTFFKILPTHDIKGETKAVTIYLGSSQILNQFIHRLCSSLLQCICPMHPQTFQNTVINVKDFELAELKTNHAQAINLVINRLSDLDSKLKQLIVSIIFNQSDMTAKDASNLLTTSLSANNTSNLSTTVPVYLSATASSNLSTPTNSNTATKLTSKQNPKAKTDTTELKIVNNSPSTDFQFLKPAIRISTIKFRHWVYPKPKCSTVFKSSDYTRRCLTQQSGIQTEIFLAAIFPFELKKTTPVSLFSEAALDTKPITVIYIDVKVDSHAIKLILDSCRVDHTASTYIITVDGATKTPISKINDFSIEINSIIPTQCLIRTPKSSRLVKTSINIILAPLIKFEEKEKKPTWEAYQNDKRKERREEELTGKTNQSYWDSNSQSKQAPIWTWEEKRKEKEEGPKPVTTPTYILYTYSQPPQLYYCQPKLICVDCGKKLSSISAYYSNNEKYLTATKFYYHLCIIEHFERPKQVGKWDNELCLACEQFHEHYQELAPTRKEQEQWLEEINTRLCDYCLIPCNFQYCNECDLIYNPPIHMIYTIPKEEKPISSCALELKSAFNPNSNSNNNNNENNSSSSAQYDNRKYSNLNSDLKPKTYIALPDLTKEQELKWFSDNNKGIMPEYTHDTDTRFDLRYLEKNSIKLELYLHTCLNLKITLEILATTMVQLASRSSLAKKKINIRRRIIDAEYIRNIIAMLQNNSEKTYIIDLNKKIAQTIFLPLVKIAQLVLVRNKKELKITAKKIQGFGSTSRINVPVNMAEKEIIDKKEIISTHQPISILLYDQYMVVIERKVKDQIQIFEVEATLCESEKIGLVNLDIPVKNHSHIKISIYNNTGDIIKIPEKTTIRYLTTEIEDQFLDTILDFSQLCGYVDITSQTIYR
ncbi:hypothetical protein G9A89_012185 [Geosiphon pyriformis]|nr:hypothetical protein G9A89_012185 [Geosiphon pyriformis]